MAADLTDSERSNGGGGLARRLGALQLAQIVHRRRAIILFEGWDGAGRHAALRKLAGAWDPCHFASRCDPAAEDGRHWLARYWSSLPAAGETSLLTRSWYRNVAEERASGSLDDKAFARRCDEINEFEAQQRDHGTLILKLFFDINAQRQAERLAARDTDPWRRWLGPIRQQPQDAPSRDVQQAVWSALFADTDTRWAPWILIDANDRAAAERAALEAVAEAFQKAMPSEPPEAQPADAQRAAG